MIIPQCREQADLISVIGRRRFVPERFWTRLWRSRLQHVRNHKAIQGQCPAFAISLSLHFPFCQKKSHQKKREGKTFWAAQPEPKVQRTWKKISCRAFKMLKNLSWLRTKTTHFLRRKPHAHGGIELLVY